MKIGNSINLICNKSTDSENYLLLAVVQDHNIIGVQNSTVIIRANTLYYYLYQCSKTNKRKLKIYPSSNRIKNHSPFYYLTIEPWLQGYDDTIAVLVRHNSSYIRTSEHYTKLNVPDSSEEFLRRCRKARGTI